MKIVTGKTLGMTGAVIVALVVGFIGGHIWTRHAMAKAWLQSILVNSWINPVTFLTYSSHSPRLVDHQETEKRLRVWLELTSKPIALEYDDMPQQQKNLIASYTKGAHNIAVSQRAKHHNMRNLSVLLNCLQMNKSTGASVRVCYTRHMQTSDMDEKKISSSPQIPPSAATQVPEQ